MVRPHKRALRTRRGTSLRDTTARSPAHRPTAPDLLDPLDDVEHTLDHAGRSEKGGKPQHDIDRQCVAHSITVKRPTARSTRDHGAVHMIAARKPDDLEAIASALHKLGRRSWRRDHEHLEQLAPLWDLAVVEQRASPAEARLLAAMRDGWARVRAADRLALLDFLRRVLSEIVTPLAEQQAAAFAAEAGDLGAQAELPLDFLQALSLLGLTGMTHDMGATARIARAARAVNRSENTLRSREAQLRIYRVVAAELVLAGVRNARGLGDPDLRTFVNRLGPMVAVVAHHLANARSHARREEMELAEEEVHAALVTYCSPEYRATVGEAFEWATRLADQLASTDDPAGTAIAAVALAELPWGLDVNLTRMEQSALRVAAKRAEGEMFAFGELIRQSGEGLSAVTKFVDWTMDTGTKTERYAKWHADLMRHEKFRLRKRPDGEPPETAAGLPRPVPLDLPLYEAFAKVMQPLEWGGSPVDAVPVMARSSIIRRAWESLVFSAELVDCLEEAWPED